MYGKDYVQRQLGKAMLFEKTFTGDGTDFSAIHEAEAFARTHNLTVGPMQREYPMGLAHDASYVSKWGNLGEDAPNLDGAIVGDSKRSGPVTLLLAFLPPEV